MEFTQIMTLYFITPQVASTFSPFRRAARLLCLRRGTFFLRRKKVPKECRLNLRFKNPLARPVPCRSLRCVPYGWKFYARGIKCSIVSAPAPLPLTAPNAGVYAPNVAGHTGPALQNSYDRKLSCAGAASPTPRDRCKRSYISKYERQLRTMADNTAFRPRPTENPANRPELK